jgi:hypothetical protein
LPTNPPPQRCSTAQSMTLAGLEPAIVGSGHQRLIY